MIGYFQFLRCITDILKNLFPSSVPPILRRGSLQSLSRVGFEEAGGQLGGIGQEVLIFSLNIEINISFNLRQEGASCRSQKDQYEYC